MYNQIDEVIYGAWCKGGEGFDPGWASDANGDLIASNYIGWIRAVVRGKENWEAKIIGPDGEPVDIGLEAQGG